MEKINLNILNKKNSVILIIIFLMIYLPKIVFALNYYKDFKVLINDNEPKTNKTLVRLTLEAPLGTRMMEISNDDYFDGSLIEKYINTKEWELSHKKGVNTVYVRFYDSVGDILATVNNIIILTSLADKNNDGMVDSSDLELIFTNKGLNNLATIGAFNKREVFNIFDFNQMMIDWSNLSVIKTK
ncbi:hypothetical protein KKH36_01710 [Patescibacteria group bacterium]|nr:hypothetical protein [Patescibacteria group bacterium]